MQPMTMLSNYLLLQYKNAILILSIDLIFSDLAKFIYSNGVSFNNLEFSTYNILLNSQIQHLIFVK